MSQNSGDNNNNLIYGGKENDILYGNGGNDILNGGNGNDVFWIKSGAGRAVIKDYSSEGDKIKLLGGLTEDDLTINQAGDDARIKYGNDLMAIVQDTLIADLTFI